MKKHLLPLATSYLALACVAENPSAPEHAEPALVVAGSSGCYTVSGTIHQTGFTGSFSGAITGDVVGTVTTQTQGTSTQGSVFFGTGQQTWEVTGGIIDALIGSTIRLELRTRSVSAQPPLLRLNNTAEIVEGASRGHLTYHGTLDVSAVPFISNVEYHGVICQ